MTVTLLKVIETLVITISKSQRKTREVIEPSHDTEVR